MRLIYSVACAALLALGPAAYAQSEPADVVTSDERPPSKPEDNALTFGRESAPASKDDKADEYKLGDAKPADEATAEDKKSEVSDDDSSDEKSEDEEADKTPEIPEWTKLRESDQEYDACRLALSILGTKYEEVPEITSPEDEHCGIARPIRVQEIIRGVTLLGGADMRCDTARALGFWTQNFLRPATAALPESPQLTGLQLGSTYACRARVGTGKERPKLSEHAIGNAIDIAAFEFSNGEILKVEPRQDTGDIAESFQRSAQSTACLYFTTVLGPGSNAAHNDHLHLDVAARKNGWRLCQ